MVDDNPMDPKENPADTGHLPVSGEVGVGPVPYHDPVTTDMNDDPSDEPGLQDAETGKIIVHVFWLASSILSVLITLLLNLVFSRR